MKRVIGFLALAVVVGAGLYVTGHLPAQVSAAIDSFTAPKPTQPVAATAPALPLVTVARVEPTDFVETVLVIGTLVPREEIMVAPEVDGLRVLDLKVDEGDRVKQGQVLATLVQETLSAKLAENDANIARADASIARARSQIVEAEARLKEAEANFERAKPLRGSGAISESVFDQREATARTSAALLVSARDGLKVAEAEKAQVEAQRRETLFRFGNSDVTAPADGLVSRRTARIGAVASLAGEAMFRIIAKGEVELDAEVPETELGKLNAGQAARVAVAGQSEQVTGTVRLVSPEVDKATRLGRVRIFLGNDPRLRIGSFARGKVETAASRGLAIPASALMYGPHGSYVQVVDGDTVRRRVVVAGLRMEDKVEIREGLAQGDAVVAKAGTFLRDGDLVRPQYADPKVSEAKP